MNLQCCHLFRFRFRGKVRCCSVPRGNECARVELPCLTTVTAESIPCAKYILLFYFAVTHVCRLKRCRLVVLLFACSRLAVGRQQHYNRQCQILRTRRTRRTILVYDHHRHGHDHDDDLDVKRTYAANEANQNINKQYGSLHETALDRHFVYQLERKMWRSCNCIQARGTS